MDAQLIVKIFKGIGVVVVGSACNFLLLLATRHVLCDDVQGKRARKGTKHRRKNPFIWFFLIDYTHHIKRWRYVSFLLSVLFFTVSVFVIGIVVAFGSNEVLSFILAASLFIAAACDMVLLSIPWGRYRN